MISAIILSRNDDETITEVIKQLTWTDEVIVIDNDSEDDTKVKAETAGAKVFSVSGRNFSKLRNIAAQQATKDWLLYIDTDETVSAELQVEIQDISKQTPEKSLPQAYVIKRKNIYLGVPWPHEDGMIRLIYKPSLVEWYGELHETARIQGSVAELKNRLVHNTHRTLTEMVAKTNEWSTIEAKLRFDANHPQIVPWRLIRVILTGFYDSYVKQSGWKAGTVGFIESIYQGFSLFITYAKLWEMQQKNDDNSSNKEF